VLIRRILHEWRASTWLGSTVFPRAQHRGVPFSRAPRAIFRRDINIHGSGSVSPRLLLAVSFRSYCLPNSRATADYLAEGKLAAGGCMGPSLGERLARLRFYSSSSCSSSSYRIMHFIQCASSSVMLISNFRTKVLKVQAWSCLASYFLRFLQTGYRPSRLHGLS